MQAVLKYLLQHTVMSGVPTSTRIWLLILTIASALCHYNYYGWQLSKSCLDWRHWTRHDHCLICYFARKRDVHCFLTEITKYCTKYFINIMPLFVEFNCSLFCLLFPPTDIFNFQEMRWKWAKKKKKELTN